MPYIYGNTSLAFGVNGGERMRIDSTGNVGIGTATPGQLLHLRSAASTNSAIQLDINGVNTGYIGLDKGANLMSSSVEGDLVLRTSNSILFGVAGDEKMRIANSGNVGIGTTSPAAPLEVNGIIRADTICNRAGTTCKTASEFTIAPQFSYQGTASSYTGGTAEQTLYTTIIPANTLGPNGALRITVAISMMSNANSKKVKIKFGPAGSETIFLDTSLLHNFVNIPDYGVTFMIRNRNATNAQIGAIAQGAGPAIKTTGAIDTTAASNLIVTGQLTNAADVIAIESVTVEVLK